MTKMLIILLLFTLPAFGQRYEYQYKIESDSFFLKGGTDSLFKKVGGSYTYRATFPVQASGWLGMIAALQDALTLLPTVARTGNYNDLSNKPVLFSGNYNDLINRPALFSGSYTDLTNKPVLFSGAWADITGKPTFSTVATTGSYNDLLNKPAASGGPSLTSLSADVTNNNAVANTIADVTGLSFPVTAATTYKFRFVIIYTAAATTTGARFTINGPATTILHYRSEYSLTATSRTFNEGLTGYNLPAASNATSATTGSNMAVIEGIITPSASGTVIARFASEVASSAIIAKAKSYVEYQTIN